MLSNAHLHMRALVLAAGLLIWLIAAAPPLRGRLARWSSTILQVRYGAAFVRMRSWGRGALILVGAALVGAGLDSYVRLGVANALVDALVPHSPLWRWLTGPYLLGDLVGVAPLAVVVIAERVAAGSTHPAALYRAARCAVRAITRRVRSLWPLAVLLVGWVDVVSGTLGEPGRQLYGWLARLIPLFGELRPEPDLRVPALVWWGAATLIATWEARGRQPAHAAGWYAVPLAGGILPLIAPAAASSLAVPAGITTAVVAGVAAVRRDRAGATVRIAWSALVCILALALTLRWTGGLVATPSSDAGGYFDAASAFHARVEALQTNPLALAYLNIHPHSREPLFIVAARASLDLFGTSLVHMRYVSLAAAVGGIYVTYLFGKRTLGTWAGLGAALLLTLEPWHVSGSIDGLREGLALLLVYGLAALIAGSVRSAGIGTAAGAGVLAAGAVLTRLDAAPTVVFLLVVWAARLGAAWRRALLAVGIVAAGVAPLLLGYRLQTGQALAPIESQLGDDIQLIVHALIAGTIPPGHLLRLVATGTAEVYGASVFGEMAMFYVQRAPVATAALLLGAYVAGMVRLIACGRLLVPALSVFGAFVPPFVYLAGAKVLDGHGGYAERYTYLIAPSAFVVCAWAITSAGRAIFARAIRSATNVAGKRRRPYDYNVPLAAR